MCYYKDNELFEIIKNSGSDNVMSETQTETLKQIINMIIKNIRQKCQTYSREQIYREQELNYTKEDARTYANVYMTSENIQTNLTDEDYTIMANMFIDNQDCNTDSNTTWFEIIMPEFFKNYLKQKPYTCESNELKTHEIYTYPIGHGHLDIRNSSDIDYPGIDIEYINENNTSQENRLSNPRILIEQPNDYEYMRCLIWNNKNTEDYTADIDFANYKDYEETQEISTAPDNILKHMCLHNGKIIVAEGNKNTKQLTVEFIPEYKFKKPVINPRVIIKWSDQDDCLECSIWTNPESTEPTNIIKFKE